MSENKGSIRRYNLLNIVCIVLVMLFLVAAAALGIYWIAAGKLVKFGIAILVVTAAALAYLGYRAVKGARGK